MQATLTDLYEAESLPRLLLDPRGRITRRSFWLWGVLALGGVSLLLRALFDIARVRAEQGEGFVSLLLLWPFIAVSAKRWHDRDKTGWWVLVALVPVIGFLYLVFENGFRRGTPGSNRYGQAPLQ